MKIYVFFILEIFHLVKPFQIKEAPLNTILDLKDYYIYSYGQRKTIFILDNSMSGNFIIHVLNDTIKACYVCFDEKDAIFLRRCGIYYNLQNFQDNYLGKFNYRKIYIVIADYYDGKIKVLNNNVPYIINTEKNLDMNCFDFYDNSKNLNFKFNINFSSNLSKTMNIQFASNLNYIGSIELFSSYNEYNSSIYSKRDKSLNQFLNLKHIYNYTVVFTPPKDDEQKLHSLLCLSFSSSEMYFVNESNTSKLFISPGIFVFYTQLSNISTIKGESYVTTINFLFNSYQYDNCTLYYRNIYNYSKYNFGNCKLVTNNNKTFYIKFNTSKENISYVVLYLVPRNVELKQSNINLFSFNKTEEEINIDNSVYYFLSGINFTIFFSYPICTLIILLFGLYTSGKFVQWGQDENCN